MYQSTAARRAGPNAAGAKVWDVTSLSPGMSTYFPEEERSQSETPASLLYAKLYITNWSNTVHRNSVTPKNNPPHRSPNKVPFIQQKRLISPESYRGLYFWKSSEMLCSDNVVPFAAARITPDSEAAE